MPDASRVLAEIQKVISDDPTIMEANRIIVSVEKRGFWPVAKEVVVLKGSVHSASDKAKVAKVASLHSFGREVLDDIIVVH